MNDDRSFERKATTRPESEARNEAPDRAVQSVLLAIETTTQERGTCASRGGSPG